MPSYSVYIHKSYFPPLPGNKPGKEDYEQWNVQASSRDDAAKKVWKENGERLLGLMIPHVSSLPRKVSLYVSNPETGTAPGRLEPITVYKGWSNTEFRHRGIEEKTIQEEKNADHFQIKSLLKEYEFVRTKGGLYVNKTGFHVKYQLPDGSFQVGSRTGTRAAQLREILEEDKMKKQKIQEAAALPKPALNTKLLTGILREAVEFQEAYGEPTYKKPSGNTYDVYHHTKDHIGTSQDGTKQYHIQNVLVTGSKKAAIEHAKRLHQKTGDHVEVMHREAHKIIHPVVKEDFDADSELNYSLATTKDREKHPDTYQPHQGHLRNVIEPRAKEKVKEGEAEEFQGMVGMTEAEKTVPVTAHRKGVKHNPINQKGTLWQQLKKKLQIEDEDLSPDELMQASIGKKTDGKDVLDELGEAEEKKPWRVIDMTTNRHVDTVHAHTEKGAKQQMTKKGHDARFHTVRLQEAKKKFPKFDQGKEVRSIARERVGQPKAKQVIVSKKFKPEKYKPKFD